jgi:uncharacterized protein
MDVAQAFLGLFLRLQPWLQLSIDQYDLLVQAIEKGYGWQDWPELQRICQRLWLKTNEPAMVAKFDREFAAWQQEFQASIADWLDQIATPVEPALPQLPFQEGVMPTIPPRRGGKAPEPLQRDLVQSSPPTEPVAIKGLNATIKIRELPIGLPDINAFCRSITRRRPIGQRRQLDLPATLRLAQKQGGLYHLAFKPIRYPTPDLLVLVDDHCYLVPYRPVYQQLMTVLVSNKWPAQIYRFTGYPSEFLFHWHDPLTGIKLAELWHQPHIERMVMVVISDAGAASGLHNSDRAIETKKFLQQAQQHVRQLYWLNPIPPEAWPQTTAVEVNKMLDGQMLPFHRSSWKKRLRP